MGGYTRFWLRRSQDTLHAHEKANSLCIDMGWLAVIAVMINMVFG